MDFIIFYSLPGRSGLGATDMRKSIDSLPILVSQHLRRDPFAGHLFGFCNRSRTIIKLLCWDRNGFCLWHKRLERHVFRWPNREAEVLAFDSRELSWRLDALDLLVSRSLTTIEL